MRKLNTSERILVSAIGILLSIFFIKNFILGPIYDKISVYGDETEQSKMAIRKYLALEYNREEILKAQKQIEGYSSLKGTDEEKSAIIMSKIEAEARKSKLQILDMNFAGSSKAKGGVGLYRINLRSEGEFKNILDFISGIEGANILLHVEKIALAVKDESSSTLKMDATILGVSFL
ncbi:MAG: hypothetical protein PHY35_04760 [Candidatus Omnitrophica bacterium]|jgi:hypothetical protein|nr:hypothetical protein [Candidatus Omnitrophota bacterium]